MRHATTLAAVALASALAAPGHGGPPEARQPPARAPSGPETQRASTHHPDEPPAFPAAVSDALVTMLASPRVPAARRLASEPFSMISAERMLEALGELTAVGADGFWRNSGSRGERAAFDLVSSRLARLGWPAASGATLERPTFRLPLAAELWRAGLEVDLGDGWERVAVGALTGHREDLERALRFDSDGSPNDSRHDPVEAEGGVVVLRSLAELEALHSGALRGTVAFVDYALLDRALMSIDETVDNAESLLAAEPSALVLVTRFSNARGVSHGSFVGDVSALTVPRSGPSPPTVYLRLEDLAAAGLGGWGDLERLRRARVTWDADVFAPGRSQSLVLTVPGVDRSRAVILGAHLDSPNTPGALDDGSGSVVLLEVARVLAASRVRPACDLVLAWFGSHERGLYGSGNFVLQNQGLLDRTTAMLEVDCLTHPLDGIHAVLVLMAQPFSAFGDGRLPFPELLRQRALQRGAAAYPWGATGMISDNSTFNPFDVPNADLIFASEQMTETHIDGHLHDPYDDLPLAALHRAELAQMARIALAAALDVAAWQHDLRITPGRRGRAVFVASHTEHHGMTPAYQTMLPLALAWEGLDVDVVPYGREVSGDDLAGADLVVALSPLDLANEVVGVEPSTEAYGPDEVDALADYVERGGLLVLATSRHRLVSGTAPYEHNEDWAGINTLATRFGVTYLDRALRGSTAAPVGGHRLVQGVSSLALADGNGSATTSPGGRALATMNGEPVVTLVSIGGSGGEVLVLADQAILAGASNSSPNLAFFENLAGYVLNR